MAKTYIGKDGYRRFSDTDNFVHRWVAGKKYGKEAIQDKTVHHIDGNKLNNDKENLALVIKDDHYNITKFESRQKFMLSTLIALMIVVLFAFWTISMFESLNKGAFQILIFLGIFVVIIILNELRHKTISSIIHHRYIQDKAIQGIKTKEVPRSNKITMKMIVIVGVIFLLAIIIVFTFSRLYSNSEYICSYDAYNCADFNTRAEAQAVMKYCGNDDIHYLDGDDDGIACESLP